MISFCNSYSVALTKESCGQIEMFTDSDGNYPDVGRLIKREGSHEKIDFGRALAEAKNLGYKLTKLEVNGGEKFMLRYKGTCYRLGLVDATYSIIDDGKEIYAYHSGDIFSPITIENDIGVCMILPVKCDGESITKNNITVIELG